MNIEELRTFCLSIPFATEDMPFKEEYLMFRVYNKWFAVIPLNDEELNMSIKCNPDYAVELRENYQSITPAWHFNKKYWNNIVLNGDVIDAKVKQLIQHSVEQVVASLPKKIQSEYEQLKTW